VTGNPEVMGYDGLPATRAISPLRGSKALLYAVLAKSPRSPFVDSFSVADYSGVDAICVNTRALVGINLNADREEIGFPSGGNSI
jgi:hypothetical protein